MNSDQYKRFGANKSLDCSNQALDMIKLQHILKMSRLRISKSSLAEYIKQIDKDMDRTGYLKEVGDDNSMSDQEKAKIKNALLNVLITF